MRISLNRIKSIEDHLLKKNSSDEAVIFEAKLILDPGLEKDTIAQQLAYDVIHLCGQDQLRSEIARVEKTIFHSPRYKGFQKLIQSIFN
ncbi:MAG TPA: hypothetical protein PKJ63_09235 [Cyclobacteriaceae bacterium]|nr:hypothetical protein [Cyclobacteriaceae bacterium]